MIGTRDITQLCCYSNLAGIMANKIEQSFYSVYSYSEIESIECTLSWPVCYLTFQPQQVYQYLSSPYIINTNRLHCCENIWIGHTLQAIQYENKNSPKLF